jgi:integrase
VIELLRAIFNRCKKLKLIEIPNPAEGIEPFKEVSRDRFLQEDEILKFFNSLKNETQQNQDFFLLSLFTGARKSNVLSMSWADTVQSG